MPTVDIIVGYSFLFLGGVLILSNYAYALMALHGKTSTSFTLVLGGVLASLGVLISPIPWYFFPLPLVLDFTIPLLIALTLRAKASE